MKQPIRPCVLVVLASVALVVSACGSSDSEADNADAPAATSSTSEPSPAATDDESAPDTEVAAPSGEVGTGVVTVDGVEYSDFVGSCSVSRGLDPDSYLPVPVGDLSEPGLNVVVGIDNVASGPPVEANFVMVGSESFRMRGVGGDGTIDSIEYVGDPPPASESTEVAEVAFSGTTDDGVPVVAEVVCEIGLG